MSALQHRTWTYALLAFLVAFIAVNFAIWKLYTEDILTFEPWYNGGLDRMGYIPGAKHYRKPESTLPRKHIENTDYHGQHIDVLTIGDSFSNMRDNGRDPLYQDWIASLYGLSVLNLQPLKDKNTLSTLFVLLNSRYLDEIKPRFIVIESVERFALSLFAQPIDFHEGMLLDDIRAYYRNARFVFNPPNFFFINNGNFKTILYSILYRYSDNAYSSVVYVRDLSRPFFSVKGYQNKLLFLNEDLKSISLATPENIRILNENLNELARRLRSKGIRLYFMPAADKYDVYSGYIVDNPYPKNDFFERLRTETKAYVLVDTKAALQEELLKGEVDVYYSDDTHWSWKGSRKIVETMRF